MRPPLSRLPQLGPGRFELHSSLGSSLGKGRMAEHLSPFRWLPSGFAPQDRSRRKPFCRTLAVATRWAEGHLIVKPERRHRYHDGREAIRDILEWRKPD